MMGYRASLQMWTGPRERLRQSYVYNMMDRSKPHVSSTPHGDADTARVSFSIQQGRSC